jgi:hypothetical protein
MRPIDYQRQFTVLIAPIVYDTNDPKNTKDYSQRKKRITHDWIRIAQQLKPPLKGEGYNCSDKRRVPQHARHSGFNVAHNSSR